MYAVCFWTKDQKISKNNFQPYLNEKLNARKKPIVEDDAAIVPVMLWKAFYKGFKHFLYFEVPLRQHDRPSYLYDLDNILRTVWLECCGHISRFNDYKRTTRIDAIPIGTKILYDYDMGSTTHLTLECIDKYAIDRITFESEKATLDINSNVQVSSKDFDSHAEFKTISTDVVFAFRNKGKFYKKPCSICGSNFHVSYMKNEKELCFDCAKKEVKLSHEDEIRNSPRIPCGEEYEDDD